VTAIGFDALWWLPLFTDAAHAALARESQPRQEYSATDA
jgi:hypothetical protein